MDDSKSSRISCSSPIVCAAGGVGIGVGLSPGLGLRLTLHTGKDLLRSGICQLELTGTHGTQRASLVPLHDALQVIVVTTLGGFCGILLAEGLQTNATAVFVRVFFDPGRLGTALSQKQLVFSGPLLQIDLLFVLPRRYWNGLRRKRAPRRVRCRDVRNAVHWLARFNHRGLLKE